MLNRKMGGRRVVGTLIMGKGLLEVKGYVSVMAPTGGGIGKVSIADRGGDLDLKMS